MGGTDRIDDRMMMRKQLVMGDVPADLDIEVEPEAVSAAHAVEQPGDALGARVVGGDPGTHQSVGGGQRVEDVDPHPGLGEKFVGGVHAGRTGPDDCHRQRDRSVADPGCGQYRRQLRDRRHLEPVGTDRVVVGVHRDERQLFGTQPGVRRDRADRAGTDTRAAIHTGQRIDVEHLGGGESRKNRRGVDAVHRARVHTRPVAAARLGDDVGHKS